MSEIALERVLAFNKELASLSAAGLRMDIGNRAESIPEVLDRANASLELRTGLGQSVTDALADDLELPPVYRHAMLTGLLTDSPAAVLDSISSQSAARDELRRTVGRSFVQPLVLLSLAYFGFLFLCLYFSPTLEGVYDQMRREPSTSVSILRTARIWMPVWAPLPPVLLIGAIFFWRRSLRRRSLWRRGRGISRVWIPLAGRYAAALRHAAFADQLAILLEKGVPLAEGVRLASGVTGDPALIETSAALASAAEQDKRLSVDDPQLRCLPPVLRWALTGDLGGQPLPEVLSFAADTYRQSARRQAAIYRIALPTLLGALLGGAVVMAYALCVFGPYIRLFRDLSV